jgi:hypothetical protein
MRAKICPSVNVFNIRTAVIAAYSALACISWGLGYFVPSTVRAGPLLGLTICALLGPSASLIHGIVGVPSFLAATFLILIAGMLALLFVGRFSHPVALWVGAAFTACVWVATGWLAWALPPFMS